MSRIAESGCAFFVLVLLLAGCESSSHSAKDSAGSSGGYPVMVTNCGTTATYAQAPSRAVSNDINTTEDMLALGLGSHMVGDFGVDGDLPDGKAFPSEYLASFKEVPDISSDYFTLEKLVSLKPDFLFAGWGYGLQTGTTLTPANLATYGIKTLALSESCARVQVTKTSVHLDDTYTDLRNLGAIFNAPQKAQSVIAAMQAQITGVQHHIAGQAPVKVFDYDSGEQAPFTAPGLAMPDALITLAGGTNIFAGLKQSWTSVSWEQVVAADPQCILINDYGTPTAAEKEQFLESSPITKDLTAVKNHCVLAVGYDELTPSPRNAEAVTAIARWLHPSAFGLAPDGA
ncbi:MAG: ABC transporter substrate-binding protein [Acidimicrobiales bacterium]